MDENPDIGQWLEKLVIYHGYARALEKSVMYYGYPRALILSSVQCEQQSSKIGVLESLWTLICLAKERQFSGNDSLTKLPSQNMVNHQVSGLPWCLRSSPYSRCKCKLSQWMKVVTQDKGLVLNVRTLSLALPVWLVSTNREGLPKFQRMHLSHELSHVWSLNQLPQITLVQVWFCYEVLQCSSI